MGSPTLEAFVVESSHVEDRLEVSVALPPGRVPGDLALPAVYVLDPEFNLPTTVAAATWLATAGRLAGGEFPPVAMVGIGYPTEDLVEIRVRRARDLTPTPGGAARFLDALVDEVMPQVEARYPVDPADRTLVGHSLGGLFGLLTLFRRPQVFSRYLIVSPSIWWDDRVVLRHEHAWAEANADLPARVFVAVGREEQAPGGGWKNEGFPDDAVAVARQVDSCRDLCSRLESRGYPGLDLELVVFDGEFHLTVGAAAITRGLIWLFSGGVGRTGPSR